MRALLVIAEMVSGGAEAVVEELARGLPDCGIEVTVASAGGRREAAVHAAGGATVRVPLAGRSLTGLARASTALHHAGRVAQPEIVHAHNVGVTFTSHLALRRLGRSPALVTTFHGVAAQDYRRAACVLDRCSDHVVVVADEIGDRLRAAGLRRVELSVVANAVRRPPTVSRGDARRALGLSSDVPVLLCPARLVPQKRHDILLEAMARCRVPAQLLLAGAGDRAGVDADIARLGLGERVRLLGERDDVPLLLAAADAVVLASDWEGMPIALLEALAAGVPVVATDVDGVREATGGSAARLVPPGDPGLLAGCLDEVLSSNDLRARMSAAGLTRAAGRPSVGSMAAGYAEIYARMLAGRPPRSTAGQRARG